MTESEHLPGMDLVDRMAGLVHAGATHRLRHERAQVAAATQGAYEALFAPTLRDPSLEERLLIAFHACRLGGATNLAAHYRERLAAEASNPQLLEIAGTAEPEAAAPDPARFRPIADERLRAMLAFTRTLIERPIEGDKAALATLPAAGLSPEAVVALAQLIAFISYQVRLVAGLRAIEALEAAK